jgi:hypothetical protein
MRISFRLSSIEQETFMGQWDFPGGFFGAVLGVGIGFLAWIGVSMLGVPLPRTCSFAFYTLGAACGAYVGGQGGSVARWCAGMATGIGTISFAIGFVGPILFHPESPQGPLLGIFVSGPFGVIAGALLGMLIGTVRQLRRSNIRTKAASQGDKSQVS